MTDVHIRLRPPGFGGLAGLLRLCYLGRMGSPGNASFAGTLTVGLKTPPWAPATNIAPTTISGGWGFKPNGYVAMPDTQFRTNANNDQTPYRAETCIFNRYEGSLLLDLNPGSGGGNPGNGSGWNWYNGRLIFNNTNGAPSNAFWLYTSWMNDGLPELASNFLHMPQIEQATGSNYVLGGPPIVYRNINGFDNLGTLWGASGDAFYVTDPVNNYTAQAIDTTPTGHGNPPFFATSTNWVNAINVFVPLDLINRLYVQYSTENGGPWLFFWQDQNIGDQIIVTPHIADDTYLDGLLQGGQCSVGVWPQGFLIGFNTAGAGPTGQPSEWLIVDINWQNYYLLIFSPQDANAEVQVGRSGLKSVALDLQGTLWYNSGNAADAEYPLFNGSVEPLAVPLNLTQNPPVSLPCFNPCVSLP